MFQSLQHAYPELSKGLSDKNGSVMITVTQQPEDRGFNMDSVKHNTSSAWPGSSHYLSFCLTSTSSVLPTSSQHSQAASLPPITGS